jgi:lipopolysaccharide assembly protein A
MLPGETLMRTILAVILITFLGAVTIFALQNTQALTVNFLGWSTTFPVAFLAVSIYFLGMLSGWSVVAFVRRSLHGVVATDPTR